MRKNASLWGVEPRGMASLRLITSEKDKREERAPETPSAESLRPLTLRTELRRARWMTGAVPEGMPNADVLRRDAVYRRLLAAADVSATALALVLALVVVGGGTLHAGAALALPLMVLLGKVVGLYDRDQHLLSKTTVEEVPTIFAVGTLLTLVIWLSNGATVDGTLARGETAALWGLLVVLTVFGRAAARAIGRLLVSEERCLVLGDESSAQAMSRKLAVSFSLKARVVGRVPLEPEAHVAEGNGSSEAATHLPLLGTIEMLPIVLTRHDVHRVIVVPGSAEADRTLEAIRVVRSLGVKVSVRPRMFEVVGSSVEFDDVDGAMLLGLHRSRLTRSSAIVKRGMDIVGSLTALVLLSPLMIAAAIAIKLTSPGPVLFRQKRVGRNGVHFDVLKFRSMRDGAEAEKDKLRFLNETEGLFKIADDPRITPVGRLLRRSSLDELPQLLNVLRGEMGLVGPRPLVPEDDAKIRGWERERLGLVPGMTGPWQIIGSTRVPLDEMVKIDYLYGANWSLWTDVKILLRTVLYVAGARSA
jgi:exopolysaccharide biosynthesis polyprenyl glycosylphosphotransferase